MSKKSAPNKLRRTWRRARSKAMCDAVRALAALEGVNIVAINDVGYLRSRFGHVFANFELVVQNSRRAYEAANPKPI